MDIDTKTVFWRSQLATWTGYGRLSLEISKRLINLGIDVRFDATGLTYDDRFGELPKWAIERYAVPAKNQITIQALPCGHPVPKDRPVILHTMWESTQVDRAWTRNWNQANVLCLVVPCRFNATIFSASGLKKNLSIINLGTDIGIYNDTGHGPANKVFRVGMAGRMIHGGDRKGIVEGIRAWREAMGDRKDCELSIKCQEDDPVPDFGDKRITIERRNFTDQEMADWYRSLDVFLSPSKGEGWGMHLHEASACGVPCITTLWGGETELLDSSNCIPLNFSLLPMDNVFTNRGVMAHPDHKSMVDSLRWCAENRDVMLREIGRRAAHRARLLSWERTALLWQGLLAQFGIQGVPGNARPDHASDPASRTGEQSAGRTQKDAGGTDDQHDNARQSLREDRPTHRSNGHAKATAKGRLKELTA